MLHVISNDYDIGIADDKVKTMLNCNLKIINFFILIQLFNIY